MVPMVPYLFLLMPQFEVASAVPPPDGFTALPLNALWGASSQPQLRLQPLLGIAVLAIFMGPEALKSNRKRLLGAGGVLLFLSLGTELVAVRGQTAIAPLPTRWLFSVPGFERMHHPIRLGAIAAPLLAACAALALSRARGVWSLGILLACGLNWKTIDNTVSWPEPAEPPGAKTARWLATHADAVVDLGSTHMQALALQTIHGKPVLSGFHPRSRPHPGVPRVTPGYSRGTW